MSGLIFSIIPRKGVRVRSSFFTLCRKTVKNEDLLFSLSLLQIVLNSPSPLKISTRKIFIVHGHDTEITTDTARFLEKLKIQPIILHEQCDFFQFKIPGL